MSPKLPHDQLRWRKSRESAQQGACIEMARRSDQVLVRDSKDPGGPVLSFDRATLADFVRRIQNDELGL